MNWETDTLTETREVLAALEQLRTAATRPHESKRAAESATDAALARLESIRAAQGRKART
jgi:hypothetical protein